MATIELTPEELEQYVGLEVLNIIGPVQQRELLVAAVKEIASSYGAKSAVEKVVYAALIDGVKQLLNEPERREELLNVGRRMVTDIIASRTA